LDNKYTLARRCVVDRGTCGVSTAAHAKEGRAAIEGQVADEVWEAVDGWEAGDGREVVDGRAEVDGQAAVERLEVDAGQKADEGIM
jgi:hypothetical protein